MREKGERESGSNVAVLVCACAHRDQDAFHGPFQRVHNRTKQNKPEEERRWRCTVCGTLRQ